MWVWDSEMKRLGFRRRGERFWLAERRHGLCGHDHLAVFSWGEQALPGGAFVVELTEFHVTFYRDGEQLHFYYHETHENVWEPGGHTSAGEVARLGMSLPGLRGEADDIAAALVEAMGGELVPRGG